ncbi:MAG: RNB domain-containing ribonuclease, partial [Planctomycetales bacterium]|nr:RNB domain-containing ribonuclease [Planctomycetales bacterium]
MDQATLEAALIELVEGPNYRPVKPKVLAERLKLPKDRLHDVKKTVKQLVKRGKLAYGSNHLVKPVQASAPRHAAAESGAASGRHVTGTYRRASGGFGFVRPSNTPPEADRDQDVYIPRDSALDAASGDLVMVRLATKRGFRGLRQGEVVEIIERETHQFVGTYFESAGTGFVQIDGTVFAQPISVGDPGAKNAHRDDKVVIEMVRFPSHLSDGEGVIVEVLGPRGEPGVDTLSIIREYGLPDEFPEDVLESARAQADRFSETVTEDRADFTGETTVTIDPVDARDFDDAISLTRLENGHWRLGVHIADVSHFVPVGSPLDREARQRATSVYLPDRVLPMLPEVISNSLASLQPGRVRYTKTVVIEMTADGAHVATDVYSAAIHSDRRFTYEEVDEFLADRDAWKKTLAADVHRLLGDMYELAMILRRRRFADGALELTLGEVKVDLDDDGRVAGAHLVEQTESHQIIEEFMLAANEAVARRLE